MPYNDENCWVLHVTSLSHHPTMPLPSCILVSFSSSLLREISHTAQQRLPMQVYCTFVCPLPCATTPLLYSVGRLKKLLWRLLEDLGKTRIRLSRNSNHLLKFSLCSTIYRVCAKHTMFLQILVYLVHQRFPDNIIDTGKVDM
jgi:hypothetical protein